MPKTTNNFAETTDLNDTTNIIDDIMRSLRVSGSVLLRETYQSPWAIDVPDMASLSELLEVSSGKKVVAFHLVEFGHCIVSPEKGQEILLKAGEMIVCFGGQAHHLSQGAPSIGQPISTLLKGGPIIQKPRKTDGIEGAGLLCGVFMLENTAFNPLFNSLPPIIHSALSKQGELHNLSGVARIMADEINRSAMGSGYIIERLLEVLCAEIIRAHIEAAPRHERGWSSGIKDPVISRAIAALHACPGDDWSVHLLASKVRMSPSRLAARFSQSVGDSPMAYLTKWRMNLACRELEHSKSNVDLISSKLGYESPAAFSRAFKKHLGLSPAAWRTQRVS